MRQPTSTPAELLSYVSQVTKKAVGTVVMVKFHAEKGYEQWAAKLQSQVEDELQKEFIEQNEFLDAILPKHPYKLLRKPTSEAATADAWTAGMWTHRSSM